MDRRCKYNWNEISNFFAENKTFNEAKLKFGFSNAAYFKALRNGKINVKPKGQRFLTAQQYIEKIENKQGKVSIGTTRYKIRTKILKEKLIEYKCAICNITEWLGHKLTLR